jgi:hypothetical protein
MSTNHERALAIVDELIANDNIPFDKEKLKAVRNYLNLSNDNGRLSLRVDRNLSELEKLSTTDYAHFQPLMGKVNGQLDILVNMLRNENQLTLTCVVSGLRTAFVSVLKPTMARSTASTLEILSRPHTGIIRSTDPAGADKQYLKWYSSWIRPIFEENKQELINELMSMPFQDVRNIFRISVQQVKLLKLSETHFDDTSSNTSELLKLACIYGFDGKVEKLLQYLQNYEDCKPSGAFSVELQEFATSSQTLTDYTLKNFFTSKPLIVNSDRIADISMILQKVSEISPQRSIRFSAFDRPVNMQLVESVEPLVILSNTYTFHYTE